MEAQQWEESNEKSNKNSVHTLLLCIQNQWVCIWHEFKKLISMLENYNVY